MRQETGMKELIRSNDLLLMSYVESLLRQAGIPHEVADEHTSAVVGLINALPRRILVEDDDWRRAKELVDAVQTDRRAADV
jgi:hypothetical protein